MKILVTGSNGFVGRNLISNLSLNKEVEIYKYDRESTLEELDKYTKDCNFVYHLAGVNRPQNPKEFMKENFDFTTTLLDSLKRNNNKCPIMISSSIQAKLNNDYGKSKKAGEDLMFDYIEENVSSKVVKIIQSYTGIVNKMVWRKIEKKDKDL